jgi:hypothetical protein
MQITRLQVIIFIIGLACAGFAYYQWQHKHASSEISTPLSRPVPKSTPAPTPSTPIKSLTPPVPAAHTPVVADESSQQEADSERYQVTKGDTLWTIARDHSPVHQGAGWVTIWRTNKHTVKNFDRIEIGWNLSIPPEPKTYITAYWRPRVLRHMNVARDGSVDLAQLPVPAAFAPGTSGWPPSFPRELEVALLQHEPMPHALAVALLQQAPIPKELALALARTHAAPAAETDVVVATPTSSEEPETEIVLDEPNGGPMLASLQFSFSDSLVPVSFH